MIKGKTISEWIRWSFQKAPLVWWFAILFLGSVLGHLFW